MLVMLCVFLSHVVDCLSVDLHDYKGHVSYAHIWASWSCSCVHPDHHGLYRFIWLTFNANDSPFWGKEPNQLDTFSKQISTGFAFTNTDWDSVTWGCSLTANVNVGIWNPNIYGQRTFPRDAIEYVVTEWQYKVILWNFECKWPFSRQKFNWEKLPNSFGDLLYTRPVSSKIWSNIKLLRTTVNAFIATLWYQRHIHHQWRHPRPGGKAAIDTLVTKCCYSRLAVKSKSRNFST